MRIGTQHALALSDLQSQTPALPQVTSLAVFLFFILFYLLSIFLIESLNILHKHPGGEDKKKETKLRSRLQLLLARFAALLQWRQDAVVVND